MLGQVLAHGGIMLMFEVRRHGLWKGEKAHGNILSIPIF